MTNLPETTPVVVGVGEYTDRPADISAALEPVALMERAIRTALDDSAPGLISQIDSIELVGLITWCYKNPVALLCERLGIAPARQVNASMGGETPIRLLHDAALRIMSGESLTAVVVGGEALHSMNRARKEKAQLNWTPLAPKHDAVRFPNDFIPVSDVSKKLGITDPAQMYPLYEMALEAAWNQSPAQGMQESAQIWEQYARVAAGNPCAWIKSAPSAAEIAEVIQMNIVDIAQRALMVSADAATAAEMPPAVCVHQRALQEGGHALVKRGKILPSILHHPDRPILVPNDRAAGAIGTFFPGDKVIIENPKSIPTIFDAFGTGKSRHRSFRRTCGPPVDHCVKEHLLDIFQVRHRFLLFAVFCHREQFQLTQKNGGRQECPRTSTNTAALL